MSDLTPRDRANRGFTLVLEKLRTIKQGDVAEHMGVSESRLSELKTKHIEDCLLFLAHLGIKAVPSQMKCFEPDVAAFLTGTHARVVKAKPELLWGENE
jgi:hypothetical protein